MITDLNKFCSRNSTNSTLTHIHISKRGYVKSRSEHAIGWARFRRIRAPFAWQQIQLRENRSRTSIVATQTKLHFSCAKFRNNRAPAVLRQIWASKHLRCWSLCLSRVYSIFSLPSKSLGTPAITNNCALMRFENQYTNKKHPAVKIRTQIHAFQGAPICTNIKSWRSKQL